MSAGRDDLIAAAQLAVAPVAGVAAVTGAVAALVLPLLGLLCFVIGLWSVGALLVVAAVAAGGATVAAFEAMGGLAWRRLGTALALLLAATLCALAAASLRPDGGLA